MAVTHSRTEVEADMRETLGLVPSFFGRIPEELLEHEWAICKRFELGETLIPVIFATIRVRSPTNIVARVSPRRKSRLRLGRAVSA